MPRSCRPFDSLQLSKGKRGVFQTAQAPDEVFKGKRLFRRKSVSVGRERSTQLADGQIIEVYHFGDGLERLVSVEPGV